MPTYNDKITMHLYHSEEGSLGSSKMFLANIPERPGPDDYMNISQLIALDGNMKPNWVNLYGIHPTDRGGSHGNKIKLSHSSSFMGRILMSLHLQQNDRPQFLQGVGTHGAEPRSITYQLWVDVYDLMNCDELLNREPVWVEI